jgi:hypothetical protein
MSLSTNALTIFFFVYSVLYNVFLCVAFLVIQGRERVRKRRSSGEADSHRDDPGAQRGACS